MKQYSWKYSILIVLVFVAIKVIHVTQGDFSKKESETIADNPYALIARTMEKHKTLDLNGYSIHYFVSGIDTGETIVFLHPAFSDHRAFDAQIEYFAQSYKVITIDMIGHGLSKANKTKDHIDKTAQHIKSILEIEQQTQAHIVGVSMGSLVAQYFGLNYPESTLSLTAVGGYNINTIDKTVQKAQAKSTSGLITKAIFSLESFRKSTAKISTHTTQGEAIFYNSASLFERKSFAAMQGMQYIIKNREQAPIPFPLMILTGEHDIALAHQMAKTWHEDINYGQYEVLAGAGHCVNMDKPQEFNHLIDRFLQIPLQ